MAARCPALGPGPAFICEPDPRGCPGRRALFLHPGDETGSGCVQGSQLRGDRARTQAAKASSCLKGSQPPFARPLLPQARCVSFLREGSGSAAVVGRSVGCRGLSPLLLWILLRVCLGEAGPLCARCALSHPESLSRQLQYLLVQPASSSSPRAPGEGAGSRKPVAPTENIPTWHQVGGGPAWEPGAECCSASGL